MRIKILTNHRTDKGEVAAGTELEVDDEYGRKLIKGEIAEEVGSKAKRVRKLAEAHETDTTEEDHGDVDKATA